ncbi:MAG: family 15 glycosyl hydrolase [Bacilli bacterium]|nr:family 15 glycosyl hydrolase [Bacilli bacterium]
MPRPLVIGNGKLLINFDYTAQIRDIYFPYVGQLNHVCGYKNALGVWTEDQFRWLDDPAWEIRFGYEPATLVTNVEATHTGLGIRFVIKDGVHQRENIYIKRIEVQNLTDRQREVRLFFNHDLMISESEVGDTAVYYPENHTVFHYKKDVYFMFNGSTASGGIYEYTTGIKRFGDAEGTWKDAEDGRLMGNAISQGSVDSTISFKLILPANGEQVMYYWMTVGTNLDEVKQLNDYVVHSQPEALLHRIRIYWNRWVNKTRRDYADLPEAVIRLFQTSLLIVRTQTDQGGAIVAANDSDILQYNRDHYSYMWPRDGALVAYAMGLAGYNSMMSAFYKFCTKVLASDGYLAHKYNPDGTIGSSWHPFIQDGQPRLPIQEDETALVLFALWQDFSAHGEIELAQSLYGTLIRPAASFLEKFIDPALGLPNPSYDLWEERYGIFTFTASAVYGGLTAAAGFAHLFGDDLRCREYQQAAGTIKEGILKHLYSPHLGRFIRGLVQNGSQWVADETLESSLFGVFEFGVLPPDDPRVASTMQQIANGLCIKTEIGGIARYTNDYYFRQTSDIANVPGNPWVICTLWVAEWEIAIAGSLEQLEKPRRALEWAASRALDSGVLPEQFHPYDGSPLSVAPLTWSHSTFVLTVVKYMKKYRKLSGREEDPEDMPNPDFLQ